MLGGTFDPVHVAHLVVALDVRHALALDRVLLVVANDPWQKSGDRAVTPAADRFAVVAAAVADLDGVEASDLELRRGGPSYTADTLGELADRHPGAELFLVVGDDVAGDLSTWVRVDEVRRRSTLVVVGRPGVPPPPAGSLAGWRVCRVDVPALDVSSTEIRARVAAGRPIDLLVPPAAVRSIAERGLYAAGRMPA